MLAADQEDHLWLLATLETDVCVEWPHARDRDGYPRFLWRVDGKRYERNACRLLLGLEKGNPLQVDHLCYNPSCVNLRHLEIVTMEENIRRRRPERVGRPRQEYCIHAHPCGIREMPSGRRACEECSKIRRQKFLDKK